MSSREQFEEWLSGITGSSQQFIRQWRSESGYADDFEHLSLWWAWQASRAALEIALPILERQERGEGQEPAKGKKGGF